MRKIEKDMKISKAKDRTMLNWVGKKSLERVKAYPAQHVETFVIGNAPNPFAGTGLGFTIWCVNDCDLQIQHNEAVGSACEYPGVTRIRMDTYFDGTRGKEPVKIVSFNHSLTPLDIKDLNKEFKRRSDEETILCSSVSAWNWPPRKLWKSATVTARSTVFTSSNCVPTRATVALFATNLYRPRPPSSARATN